MDGGLFYYKNIKKILILLIIKLIFFFHLKKNSLFNFFKRKFEQSLCFLI